jgi:hypothetical protein
MMPSLALNHVATARRILKKVTGTGGDVMSYEQLDAASSVTRAAYQEGHRDGGSTSASYRPTSPRFRSPTAPGDSAQLCGADLTVEG